MGMGFLHPTSLLVPTRQTALSQQLTSSSFTVSGEKQAAQGVIKQR